MKLYHGSQMRDLVPTFGLGHEANDYGRGFYLTADPELGREWAVGQQANADGWLHVYEVDMQPLKVFDFADVGVLAWIAELMKHRVADRSPSYLRDSARFVEKYGVDLSDYDVVKGWRADASYFFIARMFVRNQVDVSILRQLLMLGNLGTQYVLKSESAFAAAAEVAEERELVPLADYRSKFDERDRTAHRQMQELIYDLGRNPLTRVFGDLLKED